MRKMRAQPGCALRPFACAGALALAAATLPCAAAQPGSRTPPPELPAETLSTSPGPGAGTPRVYVADLAISHIADGRIRVFDASNGKLLGMFGSGYAANFALSNKADELYIATTYLSRLSRGERIDVLEVHDTASLAFKYEVALPPKRAQALSYRGLVRPTANNRFVLVQNATPATSVSVVDLQERKTVSEIATPGCWGLLPAASHPSRFSMLCGDGTVATVTLDDKGQAAERQVSGKLFDADKDAWFHHAEQVGDRYWFVSFKGTLTELDLGGASAVVKSSRPLVDAAGQRAGWRPGGYQPFAVDAKGRWLVIAMHDKGVEGSHKRPARQLWIVDLASGKRVATAPGHGAVSLTFSGNGERLHALDGESGALSIWRFAGAGPLRPQATVKHAGETALQVESQD